MVPGNSRPSGLATPAQTRTWRVLDSTACSTSVSSAWTPRDRSAASVAIATSGRFSADRRLTVTNRSGHKLPSGVALRRAFVGFRVLDAVGGTLWESGRTNAAGVLIDQHGQPIAGELWWQPDCAERVSGNPHQPHYQEITRQDQVQIYQELVTAPDQRVITTWLASPGGGLPAVPVRIESDSPWGRVIVHLRAVEAGAS